MESPSEREISEALTNMSVAEDLLIKAIAEFGNEQIQNALLKYQDRKKEYYSVKMEQMISSLKENLPSSEETFMIKEIEKLTKQRDELLAALEGLVNHTTMEFAEKWGFLPQRELASQVYDRVKWGTPNEVKGETN